MQQHFRTTFFTAGLLALILGAFMIFPAILDFYDGDKNYNGFLLSSAICIFLGGILFLGHRDKVARISVREGFFLTTFTWVFMSVLGALPFELTSTHLSLTDSVFESISGITTTGATVLSDLDHHSRGILLWRSILQWLGGIGIVAFAIILLPFLKVGGMQLFRTESSDRSEKMMSKDKNIIFSIVLAYVLLTVFCMIAYYFEGMSGFDALNHALTTLSTGGFSTHDKSFGYFESHVMQITGAIFMLLGGIPFVLYVKMMNKGDFNILKDDQVKVYLGILAFVTIAMMLYLVLHNHLGWEPAFTKSFFNVVSVVTTTGYATEDYTLWGMFPIAIFFFITYLGGCAGSTSGGAKTMRLIVGYQVFKAQIKKLVYPNAVCCTKYQNKQLDMSTIQSTLVFGALFVFINVILTFGLAFQGLDIETAFSGAATAMANVGPGIGHMIGPAGNFAALPDGAKWILDIGMLLGRLEIMTVLVLLAPAYWRA